MNDEPSARLLDLIYDAAADSTLWPAALTAVADLCGCAGGVLFGHSVSEDVVAFEHSGRMDPRCNDAYKARHVVNDWSQYVATRPTGETVLSDQVLPLERLRRTAFHDEVLRPQSLARNAMTPLARSGSFQVSFDLVRTERQGPFDVRHLASLRLVLPHIQRSLRLTHRTEGYRALHSGQQDALDRLSSGVVLLDLEAKVIHANSAAEAMFNSKRGIATTEGLLVCTDAVDRRRLDALWQTVVAGQPAASMSLACKDGSTLTLSLSSIRGRDLDRFTSVGVPGPAMLLFIADSRFAQGLPAKEIQATLGLSPAEARVALAAVEGGTIAQMGEALSLSPNTVKTHLSHVFSKMGVSRRSQLVRQLEAMAQVQHR